MNKTHKIVYQWGKTPYIIDKTLKTTDRIQLRLLNMTQGATFRSISETLFAAHGVKMKSSDRKKLDFEIFQAGSKKECGEMLVRFENLHQLDLTKALRFITPKFKKRVKDYKKKTKLKQMQEQLEHIGISLEVKVIEL